LYASAEKLTAYCYGNHKINCIEDVLNQGKVIGVHFILRQYFSGVQGIF